MKKRIVALFIFISFSNFYGFGQIEKGNLLIGGSGTINTQRTSTYKYSSIYLSPTMGIFISSKLAIGVNLPLSYRNYESSIGTGIGITPYVRYYFLEKEKSSFFIPFNIGVSNTTFHYPNSTNKPTIYTYTNGSLGIGYTHFITPSVGLEASLSYYLEQAKNSIMANPITNSRGLNLYLGLQIYLNRKTK